MAWKNRIAIIGNQPEWRHQVEFAMTAKSFLESAPTIKVNLRNSPINQVRLIILKLKSSYCDSEIAILHFCQPGNLVKAGVWGICAFCCFHFQDQIYVLSTWISKNQNNFFWFSSFYSWYFLYTEYGTNSVTFPNLKDFVVSRQFPNPAQHVNHLC